MKYAIGVQKILITKIYCELEGKIPIIPKGILPKKKKHDPVHCEKHQGIFCIQNTAPRIFVDKNS